MHVLHVGRPVWKCASGYMEKQIYSIDRQVWHCLALFHLQTLHAIQALTGHIPCISAYIFIVKQFESQPHIQS